VTGLLLVDKPEGMTSAGAIRALKPRLGRTKVGHLGTLDPFASGLLPLCLGEATKVARYLLAERKAYTGTIRLGVVTDTLDRTGQPLESMPVPPIAQMALDALATRFTGPQEQVPPMYSALKRAAFRSTSSRAAGSRWSVNHVRSRSRGWTSCDMMSGSTSRSCVRRARTCASSPPTWGGRSARSPTWRACDARGGTVLDRTGDTARHTRGVGGRGVSPALRRARSAGRIRGLPGTGRGRCTPAPRTTGAAQQSASTPLCRGDGTRPRPGGRGRRGDRGGGRVVKVGAPARLVVGALYNAQGGCWRRSVPPPTRFPAPAQRFSMRWARSRGGVVNSVANRGAERVGQLVGGRRVDHAEGGRVDVEGDARARVPELLGDPPLCRSGRGGWRTSAACCGA